MKELKFSLPWSYVDNDALVYRVVYLSKILSSTVYSLQAILLEHITGDAETRFLYEVLAEASLVFPGVFPVM